MLETVNFGLKLYRKNNHTTKVRTIRYYHLDKWIALAYVPYSYTHMLNTGKKNQENPLSQYQDTVIHSIIYATNLRYLVLAFQTKFWCAWMWVYV